MYLHLEKIDIAWNHWHWYVLSVQPTLFGEWTLIREWGRIGNDGGRTETAFYGSELDAVSACNALKAIKKRRGYTTRPEQLDLPLWG